MPNDYSYASGDGAVTLTAGSGSNSLQLGAGLSWPNVHLVKSGTDLVITDTVSGDTLDLSGEFAGGTPAIQSIVLGDGTAVNVASAVWGSAAGNVYGTSGNDLVFGGVGTENLLGNGGSDTLAGGIGTQWLYGNAGNDTLIGGVGTQQLWGNGGNDTFIFGQGNQIAFGGTGNDTYSYSAGDGTALINDQGGANVLKLGPGLTTANVKFSEINSYGDLYVTDGIAGDQLEIEYEDLFSGAPVIPMIVFSDGSTLTLENGIAITGTGVAVEGSLGNDTIYGTTGTQDLAGEGGNDTIIGGNGQDRLYGGAGNDTLIGGVGTQQLWGNGGNDVFIFGQGNQIAFGNSSTANDTYSYSGGDGAATIVDSGGTNILRLGAGLSWPNVTLARSGSDLLITDTISGDTLDLSGEFAGSTPMVQTIVLGDGTVVSAAQETLVGSGGNTIIGGIGSYSLLGGSGNDTLIGGVGAQTMWSDGGNDTFIFGHGSQLAYGNDTGNDIYSYAGGDGAATIADSGGTDILSFGSGIADDQLWFAQSGSNLVVSVIGTGDTVTVQGWYGGGAVETITAGGKTLQSTQVANLVTAMASLTPPAAGQTTLPTAEASQLEPVIAANWH